MGLVRPFSPLPPFYLRGDADWNTGGDANSMDDFNPLWISEFKTTNAYDVWERTTDSLLFDIVEPR